MFSKFRYGAHVATCLVVLCPRLSRAEPSAPCTRVSRENIVACARTASLSAAGERAVLESFAGRELTARTLLPANPVVALGGGIPLDNDLGYRENTWSARLSQQIEIGGQRSVRKAIVARERAAQEEILVSAERRDVALGLQRYYDAIAARDAALLAVRSSELAKALRELTVSLASTGLGAPSDATLAEATAIALESAALAARARERQANVALATSLGSSTYVEIDGDLAPWLISSTAGDPVERHPDVVAASQQRSAAAERARLLERSRVPSPTVGIAASNDWINERVVGLELSIPVPLPAPVGQTNRGAIDEALSLVSRADSDLEATRRRVRLELRDAEIELATREAQLALYDTSTLQAAERTLRAVTEEIAARRLRLHDAILMQRTLLDVLYAAIDARRQVCVASVTLALLRGQPFEEGVTP